MFRLFVESRHGVLIATALVCTVLGTTVGAFQGWVEGLCLGGFVFGFAVFELGAVSDLVEKLDRSLAVDAQQAEPLSERSVLLRSETTYAETLSGIRKKDLSDLAVVVALAIGLLLLLGWEVSACILFLFLFLKPFEVVARTLLLARASYDAAMSSDALELGWPNQTRVLPLEETVVGVCSAYRPLTQVEYGDQIYVVKFEGSLRSRLTERLSTKGP